MWNWPLKKALFIAVAALVTGLLVIVALPVVTQNPLFVLGVPFAAFIFLFMALDAKKLLLIVLFSRALLDPVLGATKIGGGAGLGGILNLVVIGLSAAIMARFPKEFFDQNRFAKRWTIFLVVGLISVSYSVLRVASLKLLLNQVTYFCMAMLPFFVVRSENDRRGWVKALLLSSILPLLIADVGLVTRAPLFLQQGRLQGAFTHPNILAFYVVFCMAVLFYAMKTGAIRVHGITAITAGLYALNLAVLLVATETRSAWIACWSLFFIYGLLKERRYLAVCILVPLLLLAAPQVRERLDELKTGASVTRRTKLNSMAWRLKLWKSSVPEILRRPVFGHGMGTFEYHSISFFTLEKLGSPAHNIYVETLFEIGLVGLVAFLGIFFHVLSRFAGRLRSAVGHTGAEAAILIAYVTSYLIVGYSDNMLYYLAFNWYFWFFCGLALKGTMLEAEKPATV